MPGSIRDRGNGKYELTISAGYGGNGKRKRYYKTIIAKSHRAAEKELAKFLAEVEGKQFTEPSKVTVAEFANKWYQDYVKKSLSPTTAHRYAIIFNNAIIPCLGHIKMDKLKPMHLMEFYKMLEGDGVRKDGKEGCLAPKTILQYHRVLSSMLQDAVQWQIIKENPAARVKPPRVYKKKAICYDEEQTATLLKAIEEEDIKYKLIIYIAITTGLRRGEILGLEWPDIDLEKRTIKVERISVYIDGQGIITKKPKTETSEREISFPEFLIPLLKRHKSEQLKQQFACGENWHKSDRLFTTWDGKPMHPSTPSNWFDKFLKKKGLPNIPFHGLRHTSATLLIAEGIHAKVISSRLGHSNISTTMDIYGHFLKSADKEAANVFEKYNIAKQK